MLEIINKLLETGIFPDNWKESMVTPIEKIKNTNKCEQFRPMNSLKTFEKVLDTVVKQRLENYMEENKLLSKYQSGFKKKFSCETTVNYAVSRWKNAKNNKILAIFLDFRGAFKTIDKDILLQKELAAEELMWLRSYLTNRKQKQELTLNLVQLKISMEYDKDQY